MNCLQPGLPNCKGSICAYVKDGVMHPNNGTLVTGEEKDIEVLTLGNCPSRFVAIAIGGGGKGYRGGGGSGHVNHTTNFPKKAYVKMRVHPGKAGEDSFVIDLATNIEIVRGRKGQDGDGDNGGAGE